MGLEELFGFVYAFIVMFSVLAVMVLFFVVMLLFVFILVVAVLNLIAKIRLLRKIERSVWYAFLPFLVEVLLVSESNLEDKVRKNLYSYIWIMMICSLVAIIVALIPFVGWFFSIIFSISVAVFYIIYTIQINKSFIKQSGESTGLVLPLVTALFLGSPIIYYGFSKNSLVTNRDYNFNVSKYKVMGFVCLGTNGLVLMISGLITIFTVLMDSILYW